MAAQTAGSSAATAAASAGGALARTARASRPIWSSWPSASGRTPRWPKDAGLDVNRGIVVDDTMQTSDPRIFAVGECVEHSRQSLWPRRAALRDGEGAGAAHAGETGGGATPEPVPATKLKVTGIDLFSRRRFRRRRRDARRSCCAMPARGVYKRRRPARTTAHRRRALRRHGRRAVVLRPACSRAADITDMRDTLIFGQAYRRGCPADPMAAVAALPMRRKSAAATASARARSCKRSREGPDHARRRARAHQGSPPAAPAPGWSSSC